MSTLARTAGGFTVIIILGAVLGLGMVATLGGGETVPTTGPTLDAIGTSSAPEPSQKPDIEFADAETTSFVDASYDTALAASPTGHDSQSKLWFHADTWWGILLNSDHEHSIHRLDWASQVWQDTATLVDERAKAHADVLWSGTHLYVVTARTDPGEPEHALRFIRFSYAAEEARYGVDPGFPVALTAGGATGATIAQDTTGRLWTAFVADEEVLVAHTMGEDHRIWSDPEVLPAEGTSVSSDIAAVAAYGTRIGVMWSNQNEDAFYFASREDRDPPDVWSASSAALDGVASADDHINLKVDEETDRMYAVVKTGYGDVPGADEASAQLMLLALTAEGTWEQHPVTRVRDGQTRPVVVIDDETRSLHVFAAGSGGVIYRKSAALDDIWFANGRGEPFIADERHTETNTPTTTKQAVDGVTGLVILASDNQSGRYLHGSMSLGGPQPGGGPTPPALAARTTKLFEDNFDTRGVNEAPGNGWALADQIGSLSSVEVGAATPMSALVSAAGGPDAARACKDIPPTRTGVVVIEASVLVEGTTDEDVEIPSVRGVGGEFVSVRFAPEGSLAYFDGDEKLSVPGAYSPGRWYRSRVTIDLVSQTYGWEMTDSATGQIVLSLTDAAWRTVESPIIDKLCFQVPAGLTRLNFDDVTAVRVAD